MASRASQMQGGRHSRIVDLLVKHQVVFGWVAPALGANAAKQAATDARMDFVYVDMEVPLRFDPAALRAFREHLLEAGLQTNPNTHPLAVRLPTFRDDPVMARRRVAEILNVGAHAIVFPAVETRDEAAQAIAAMRFAKHAPTGARPAAFGEAPPFWGMSDQEYEMRADTYPLNPVGELAAIVGIATARGVASVREIAALRPAVVFAEPGTLRRAMQDDVAKVEAALQAQLAVCTELGVACGIPASAADVARRIKEGVRVILIEDRDYPETIAAGRAAAGRR